MLFDSALQNTRRETKAVFEVAALRTGLAGGDEACEVCWNEVAIVSGVARC